MNKKIVGFLPIFLIAFVFILIANPAQAATSAECKAAATKCIAPCSVSTPSLLACKSNILLYTKACWLKFPYNGQAPKFVIGQLDSNAIFSAEANKFADNNLIIDEGTAKPYPCGISYLQNCTDQASCEGIKYFWQGGKCVKSATDQCAKDMDCANTQYCDTAAKPKSCVAKKADGEICSIAKECTGGYCNASKCASNSGAGCAKPCNEVNEYCNGTDCVAKKKPGESCAVLTQCLTGVCVGGKCGCNDDVDCETTRFCDTTKICKDKLITGKPCTKVSQCLSNICLEGYCKCTPPNKGCTDTQYCDEAQSCSVKKKDAKACKYNYECQTNDCSGTPNKTCGGITGCATDCTTDGTHFCKIDADGGATCLIKKLDCQPCETNDYCKSGKCENKKCKGATDCGTGANPLKGEGETCADDSECASDNCNPSTKKCMADLSCDENHLSKCLNGPLCLNAGGHWWKSDSKCHAEVEGTAPTCAEICPSNQYCSDTGCANKKNDGETCSADNECTTDACKGAGGTCGLAPAGGPGAGEKKCEKTCTINEWCDTTVPVCKPKIEENSVCTKAEQCKTAYCSPTGKCTTAPAGTGGTEGAGATPSEFGLPNFLGVDDPSIVIGRIIKFIMGFVGTIALVIFIYGGVLWLISAGRDEYVTKGKNAMVWSTIGLVIVFSGYILVKFVFSLFGK